MVVGVGSIRVTYAFGICRAEGLGVEMGVGVWLVRLGCKHWLMGLGRIASCKERRDWMLKVSILQVLGALLLRRCKA